MILAAMALLGMSVGIVLGAYFVVWQQELEERDHYLPDTWEPKPIVRYDPPPPEGWWP